MRPEKSQREGGKERGREAGRRETASIELTEETQGSCDLVTISSHCALCKQDSRAQRGEATFHRSLDILEPGWSKEPVIEILEQSARGW